MFQKPTFGYRKQVTNEDINQEGVTSKGTRKPQQQLLVMPEFTKLMDNLQPDDDMDSHVVKFDLGTGSK